MVPLFDNAGTVAELCRRIRAALDPVAAHEILLVVDACPRGSGAAARDAAAADARVRVVDLRRRSGQHGAARAGLEAARGEWVVVMDGDLQDPPEAVPALLAAAGQADAVFAAREGRYEEPGRHATAYVFRALMAALAGLPRQAGMFFAVRREVARRAAALRVREPYVPAMIAHAARAITTVPVLRQRRPSGRSAYSRGARLLVALRALCCAAELRSMRARAAESRRSPLAAVLVVAGAAVYYMAQAARFPFRLGDEGYLFHVADAVNHGRVLYRDVQLSLYPPELFHLFALVLRIVGRSIAGARMFMAAFLALDAGLAYLVARRFAGRFWAAVVTLVVGLVPGPWHKFYVGHCFLLVLLAALRAAEGDRGWRRFVLGMAVAWCLYLRLDAFVVGLALMALVAARRTVTDSLRAFVPAAAGLLCASVPLVVDLVRRGILGAFGRQLAGFTTIAAARTSASYRLSPPLVSDLGRWTSAGAFATLFYGSLVLPAGLALVLTLAARRRRRADADPSPGGTSLLSGLILLLWVAGNLPQYALERPDASHLSQRMPALVLAAVAALAGAAPRVAWARLLRGAAAVLLLAFLGLYVGFMVRQAQGGSLGAAHLPARTVRLASGQVARIREGSGLDDVVNEVVARTRPGEAVATLPYAPGVNFLAERPLPTRYVYVLPSNAAAAEADYLDALERRPVREVVFDESFRFTTDEAAAFAHTAPRLAAELAAHYEETLRRGSLVVLRRRGS